MSDDSNVDLIRRIYDTFERGDYAALGDFIVDDAIWHVGGRNLFSDEYRGTDAILTYVRKLTEFTNGTLKIEVHDILASGTHAVALVRYSAQRARSSIEMDACSTFHLRQGKVTEGWTFHQDQYAADGFFTYQKHSQGRMP